MMVRIWNFFLYQNFLHYTFYIPTSRSLTTITEQNSYVVVKLPEVNFFLQKSVSDIFPCFRKIQISKIHATPSPRENTSIIIKLENFKLSRPNLQWEKEYHYFIMVDISVFVGRGQKKIGVCDCKELRCYFFLQNFVSDIFPCSRKVRISKITGIPFPEKIRLEYKF